MKLNKKFKSLLKLTNDLELYELSVHNNLERLEESIEEMKIEDPDSFERAVGMVFAPDDEDLAISFGIKNGEAAAKVLTLDYINVAKERTANTEL